MKKFVSIVIALVMVLSMTSAFANACVTGPFSWDCATTTTNCGKATVEVIPYVKTNSACDTVAYVESDCAAAINGENIYYALKLTVDADIDPEWWATAKITVSVNGTTADVNPAQELVKPALTGDVSEDGWVFYYVGAGVWAEATEDSTFDIADVMQSKVVKSYAKTKVCLTLKAANEFTSATVGDYFINYAAASNAFSVKNDNGSKVVFYMGSDDKIEKIDVENLAPCDNKDALIKEVLEFLGLGCGYGVCVTADAMAANFGWNDKIESCFDWQDNGTAVVNPDCSVEIPKTGDVSVVAYAVMAIAAAAGMLKK